MSKLELSIGDRIEVKTEHLAYGGQAVARHKGFTVFVQEAAPDETLRVRIVERKKNYARAVIEEIITPSPARREPPCKYFGECGGCQLQHINYETQLSEKIGFIRDALKRTGQIDWTDEIKIHSSKEFNYRLRAKIKIDQGFTGNEKAILQNSTLHKMCIGFYQAHSHNVCDIARCEILLPELNEALKAIRARLFDNSEKIGNNVNEIEIAVNQNTDSDFQTTDTHFNVSTSPPIAGFPSNDIQREIAGAIYQFSPLSFFQVNALLLDEFVKEAVGFENGDFAIDLYAGVGLFTIRLARNFKQVIGVESNARTVAYAEQNISINKTENARVVCNRTDTWLKNFLSQSTVQTPDLVLLDPPRNGAAEAIDLIIKLNPKRIHYVSCDPVTLARDLKQLVSSQYEIERIVAFDMFPQTYHIESIAFLKRH
jgi:23S rRNA (uracil1939-C5)-methyltransferase